MISVNEKNVGTKNCARRHYHMSKHLVGLDNHTVYLVRADRSEKDKLKVELN